MCHEFLVKIVLYSFKWCGYVFEDDIDYIMNTESELKINIHSTLGIIISLP